MEQVLWTEELSLQVPLIDAAHKKFLEHMTQVANTPDDQLSTALFGLISAMEKDFQQEEAAMEKVDYPDIKPHREQHARVLASFHEVIPDVLKGDFKAAHHVLELLPSWLVLHITTMDRALVLYMNAHPEGQTF